MFFHLEVMSTPPKRTWRRCIPYPYLLAHDVIDVTSLSALADMSCDDNNTLVTNVYDVVPFAFVSPPLPVYNSCNH